VHAGSVGQRRGLFTKKRYLILTDKPRLLYLDEGREPDGSGGKLRTEIDWTPKLSPELKGTTAFSITTVSTTLHELFFYLSYTMQ
jgi:3-phosphoinositide dependent protein kinase-1